MSPHAEKLHPLTTLRFFAAAMIVITHSAGLFGFPHEFSTRFELDQAVSFFFVLSGFILTYVYPRLETAEDRRRFWLARFARIWPAHVAAFLFLWILLRSPHNFPSPYSSLPLIATNLMLVQAWIPIQRIFFSYNPVSWSISTEMAFYLAFPFLIRNWHRTWHIKLLLTLALALGAIAIAFSVIHPGADALPWQPVTEGIFYINPCARLFEFTLGMATCLLFRYVNRTMRLSPLAATVVESAAFFMMISSMYFTRNVVDAISRTSWLGPNVASWAVHGPACAWAFALLILVMALQRGWLSRVLSHPLGILLGELSFSVYLLHFTLRTFYFKYQYSFDRYPGWITYSLFWAILLVLSWLVWAGFERPVRSLILSFWSPAKRSSATAPASTKRILFAKPKAFVSAAGALLLLSTPVAFALLQKPIHLDRHDVLDTITRETPPAFRNVHFANVLELVGCQFHRNSSGAQLLLTWRAGGASITNVFVGIHILNDSQQIISQADFNEDPANLGPTSTAWTDTIALTSQQLQTASSIGIVVYQTGGATFQMDHGPSDWDRHRLLFTLKQPPATTR